MTILLAQDFEIMVCYNCSVSFAMTVKLNDRRRSDQKSFWCPNGHQQSYCKSTESKLKERLEKQVDENRELEARLGKTQEFLANARHSARAHKGAHTKTRKRVSHGVCPCCNRTFDNLARHMKGQHPNYAEATIA